MQLVIRNHPTHIFRRSAYKSTAADSLLAERGRIDSSHRMTDDMIAYVSFDTLRIPYHTTCVCLSCSDCYLGVHRLLLTLPPPTQASLRDAVRVRSPTDNDIGDQCAHAGCTQYVPFFSTCFTTMKSDCVSVNAHADIPWSSALLLSLASLLHPFPYWPRDALDIRTSHRSFRNVLLRLRFLPGSGSQVQCLVSVISCR